jgi:hypothetical protein
LVFKEQFLEGFAEGGDFIGGELGDRMGGQGAFQMVNLGGELGLVVF